MPPQTQTFNSGNFRDLCDRLATSDPDLARVITGYGYPPMWQRSNSFETLVHIILEQQVSLASAKAALEKLRAYIGDITPEKVLPLSDGEFKQAYFSRQKTGYVRRLAQEIADRKLELTQLGRLPDKAVRERLVQLPGIGNWTVDIYLIMVLQRPDIFPVGDLAAINAVKHLKGLPAGTPRDELLPLIGQWQPYRTVAAMIIWHYYLSKPARNGH